MPRDSSSQRFATIILCCFSSTSFSTGVLRKSCPPWITPCRLVRRASRAGRDVSVITYAAMVYVALEAAEILAKEGVELEVVDLRTVLPLDREAVRRRWRKRTG